MAEFALFFIALVGSSLAMPFIIRLFRKHGILDLPGARKVHREEQPTMGGVGLFMGMLLGIAGVYLLYAPEMLSCLVLSFSFILAVGLADDLFEMRARYKLIGQLIATTILIFFCDVRLTSFHGLLGWGTMAWPVSIFLTYFTVIVVTNALNLLDGIDGLAASIGLSFFMLSAYWFWQVGARPESSIALVLCGASLGFLRYNWAPSRIFMGDTGSLLLGFAMAWLAIRFIELNAALNPILPLYTQAAVATGIAAMGVPLFDTLRLFTMRVWRGRSPFSPDKHHIHHLLTRNLQYSHAQASALLVVVNIGFVALAWAVQPLSSNWTLFTLLLLATLLYLLVFWKIRRANARPKSRPERMMQ